ncbi:hypothetical protein SAQ01S_23590 [Sphingomonas aquatilis NBRC 16722]|nr:hypothetical protein SAQ01S_23590 [Sphingomonas aquatilis NBRC 16722]
MNSSAPQCTIIGKAEDNTICTAVFKGAGQPIGSPSGCAVQSIARNVAAQSPPDAGNGKRGSWTAAMVTERV